MHECNIYVTIFRSYRSYFNINFLYVHVPTEMIQQSLCFIGIKQFNMLFSYAIISLLQSKGIK